MIVVFTLLVLPVFIVSSKQSESQLLQHIKVSYSDIEQSKQLMFTFKNSL